MGSNASRPSTGIVFGVTAYLLWGVFPIFFKLLTGLAPLEFVAYRCLWSLAWLALLLTVTSRWGEFVRCTRCRRTLGLLVISAALIGSNWGLFLYTITSGQVLQSSLGYFINPLVSVLLGVVFLRERVRPLQAVSIGLATTGVLILTCAGGRFPWLALSLAITFGLYGLTRKMARADAAVGLTVETSLMAPAAAVFLLLLSSGRLGAMPVTGARVDYQLLLVLAGPVTIVPLMLFISAARRLPLSMVGMLQYITPTLHFVLAVVVYDEPFRGTHLACFVFIWLAVALYLCDAYRRESTPEPAVARGAAS